MCGYKQVLQSLRHQLWELSMQEERSHCYQALQKAQAVAAMLKEHYGVKQVYLYGSLAREEFDRCSGVDLGLVGFSGDFRKAMRETEALASPIGVNLKCLENCDKSLQKRIVTRGVLL
jgi:predicted nucleotidyltransferase